MEGTHELVLYLYPNNNLGHKRAMNIQIEILFAVGKFMHCQSRGRSASDWAHSGGHRSCAAPSRWSWQSGSLLGLAQARLHEKTLALTVGLGCPSRLAAWCSRRVVGGRDGPGRSSRQDRKMNDAMSRNPLSCRNGVEMHSPLSALTEKNGLSNLKSDQIQAIIQHNRTFSYLEQLISATALQHFHFPSGSFLQ